MICLTLGRIKGEVIAAASLDRQARAVFAVTAKDLRHGNSFHFIPIKTLKHKTERNDIGKFSCPLPSPPQIRHKNHTCSLRIQLSYLGRVPEGRVGLKPFQRGRCHYTEFDRALLQYSKIYQK